jgi:16S rRNA processing protein RimM
LSDELRRSHLEVGVVGRAHGIRGELKVRLHNAGSDALTHVTRVLLTGQDGPRAVEVERVRPTPSGSIVQLKDVASREQAEALRGLRVLVLRSELPPLDPGDYYLVDLIGCAVLLRGETLGRAIAVRPDPTVDTLIIELPTGSKVEQPILDPWILRVDVERAIVELASDDGLIV